TVSWPRTVRAISSRRARAWALPASVRATRTHRCRQRLGRFERRAAHGHAAQGRRPRSPPHRCHMIRKILLTFLLVFAGFVAGLVVTGRMRRASDSSAEPIPAPEPQVTAPRPGAPPPAPLAAVGVGPDFTRIAGQAIKGVANISSLQVVRRQN